MLAVVPDDCPGQPGGKDGSPSLIDEIVRESALRMLAEALQAEVDAYIEQFAGERDEGRRHPGAAAGSLRAVVGAVGSVTAAGVALLSRESSKQVGAAVPSAEPSARPIYAGPGTAEGEGRRSL
jgi:hypothetical protein